MRDTRGAMDRVTRPSDAPTRPRLTREAGCNKPRPSTSQALRVTVKAFTEKGVPLVPTVSLARAPGQPMSRRRRALIGVWSCGLAALLKPVNQPAAAGDSIRADASDARSKAHTGPLAESTSREPVARRAYRQNRRSRACCAAERPTPPCSGHRRARRRADPKKKHRMPSRRRTTHLRVSLLSFTSFIPRRNVFSFRCSVRRPGRASWQARDCMLSCHSRTGKGFFAYSPVFYRDRRGLA
jgi:hypothetical protein